MMFKESCLLLLIAAACVSAEDLNQKKYKVVCYLGSWANYRQNDGKFLIEHIDPFLCTHVIYGFAKLQNNQIAIYDPYLDLEENWGLGAFERFNDMKKVNPDLKTIIAIGGWNEGSTKYSEMAKDGGSRATFVKSVVDFLDKYGFDGLDMDWEYPANRGGVPEDKQTFITLLKELKEALGPRGKLLTAAVSAGKGTIDTAYDIPGMARYLDFINVMAYDLHGSWEKETGHNAPLYVRDEESGDARNLNVDFAMNYWVKGGAPKSKLVLGMGTYGRSFALASASNTGLGAPATGPGGAGPMTREPGMLGYNEICLFLQQGWKSVFAPKLEAPYAYSGNQWVGYDDVKSIGIKTNYLMKEGFAGGMIWSVETDDFRGLCGEGSFPLLTTIARKLNGDTGRPTNPPPTPRPTAPPTAYPGELFKCPDNGHFRDYSDCATFYICRKQPTGDYARHTNSCGNNMGFEDTIRTCLMKKDVPAC